MDFPRAITRECMKGVLLMSVQSSKNQYHPELGGNYNLKRLSAREGLRNRYCPDSVRILFVGKSPPASGRFFYQADSGLYRAVREAFVAAIAPPGNRFS